MNRCYGCGLPHGQLFLGGVRSGHVSNGSTRLRQVLSQSAARSPKPVLLLDFDGTVCLGDGPVLAYAQEAFGYLPANERSAVRTRLAAFLSGDPDLLRQYADGYGCVQDLVADHLSPEQLSAAFLTSRKRLATEDLGTSAAAGIKDLLSVLDGSVTRVLLTNSPAVGVVESIKRFGLSELFDQVVVGARKQHRMGEHVAVLTDGRPSATLISVGDHWANDVAVPLQRGCATGYISGHPGADEPAHLCGRDLATVAPGILDWAQDPVEFVASHEPIAVAR